MGGTSSTVAPEPFIPRPYQQRAINRWATERHLFVCADMGTGKSGISLAATQRLIADLEIDRALIVSPLKVCQMTWPTELEKFEDFSRLRASFITGTPKQRKRALETDADVYFINPEGVVWLTGQHWRLPDQLVIDESSMWKNANTTRFKALRKMLGKFSRRYAMTGTPCSNGLDDLFWQVYLVDQGKHLGRSISAFRREYFTSVQVGPKPWHVKWTPNKHAFRDVMQRIAPVTIRIELSELKGMPEGPITTPIRIALPPAAMRQYRTLARDGVLEVDSGTILPENEGAVGMKLRQIASGTVWTGDDLLGDRRIQQIHTAKTEALARLSAEMQGKPLLIVYAFTPELEAIRKVLGYEVPTFTGTSRARAKELETRWNRGELPHLAMHPASGGHGTNLQFGGNHLVWYSLTWNQDQYDQVCGRLHRGGQTDRVMIYQLIADKTVEQKIAAALVNKALTQAKIVQLMREECELCC